MQIFFGKHSGKHIEELDSGYLLWIIEFYEKADWLLINACKAELSSRLKLDWTPPDTEENKIKKLNILLTRAQSRIVQLESLLAMAIICRGNKYIIHTYECNQSLLESDLLLIQEIQLTN